MKKLRALAWSLACGICALGLAAWFTLAVVTLMHGRWGMFALYGVLSMLTANGALYARRRAVPGWRG